MLEAYGPKRKYIKYPDKDAADALRRIPLIKSDVKERKITREYLSESYCVDKLDSDTLSLTYQTIHKYQR